MQVSRGELTEDRHEGGSATPFSLGRIMPESLGSPSFRKAYRIRYAYVAGAMYKGIASPQLVIALGSRQMLGFLGTGGVPLDEIEKGMRTIQSKLGPVGCYGANLLSGDRELENRTVELYLRLCVRNIEAAAFVRMTPALVRYRLCGLRRSETRSDITRNRILAKVSRPEIARAFMSPPPVDIVNELLSAGLVSTQEAELGATIPMADDICVEADSGGHTDRGVAFTLFPAISMLRDALVSRYGYTENIHVGVAGGIGVPEAAAAAFIMGADFILTGSINQCTVEAGTSAAVKDLLQEMDVQDTDYAPAADMFEIGAKVQVLKRGLLFPARANRLQELFSRYNSLEEIGEKEREKIQNKYFTKSFAEVWQECREHIVSSKPEKLSEVEQNPKKKMAAVFKWYLMHSTRLALEGDVSKRLDFQIQCGPALGAFNTWVRGTSLENWRNRYVAQIGERLIQHTADVMNSRFRLIAGRTFV